MGQLDILKRTCLFNPFFLTVLDNIADSGMGVLQVEYGIFIRLIGCKIQVKIKVGIHAAHDEKIAYHIGSQVILQFIQSNKIGLAG